MVNYSRFIGRAIELKKPFVIKPPSGRVPEKVPRWDLMGTEGYDGGKVFWWALLMVLEYLRIYRAEREVGGLPGGAQGTPPGRALRACGALGALLTWTQSSVDVFWSKKNHRESFIPFGLCLVFLFCETLKQGKNMNWHWALG